MTTQKDYSFYIGLFLCVSGFLLSLTALSITVYNYEHSNDSNLRFERIVIELVSQISIIMGFALIYYNAILNIEEIRTMHKQLSNMMIKSQLSQGT
jgi:hypothetical protein